MTVRDGIRRARFHTVATENAARIVDVVNAGVAFPRGNTRRVGVLRRLDIDAIRGAGRRTKETSHAFFETALIPVQDVNPAIPRLKMNRFVRIIFGNGLAEHRAERHAEALYQSARSLDNFAND